MTELRIPVEFRDLQPPDLDFLAWTGDWPDRDRFDVALNRVWADKAEAVVAQLPNGTLIASGEADFEATPGVGTIRMLVVHPAWRSLGVGGALISELERRIADRRLTEARLQVEHDNPRARALYVRLGYRDLGTALEAWPQGDHTFVSVSAVLGKSLASP